MHEQPPRTTWRERRRSLGLFPSRQAALREAVPRQRGELARSRPRAGRDVEHCRLGVRRPEGKTVRRSRTRGRPRTAVRRAGFTGSSRRHRCSGRGADTPCRRRVEGRAATHRDRRRKRLCRSGSTRRPETRRRTLHDIERQGIEGGRPPPAGEPEPIGDPAGGSDEPRSPLAMVQSSTHSTRQTDR